MAYAEEHNRPDTVDHIKGTHVSAPAGGDRQIRFMIQATGDAVDVVERAMRHAKRLAEKDDNNTAFEYIVGEWLNMTEGIELSLEEAVRVLVRRFGEEAVAAHVRERSRTAN
jgi:hypothetical protein